VLSRAGYYACMRSGSFADRLSSGGVFRLASYYACMRSSRPEAETRAHGCCHARAITHACAAGASGPGSRARGVFRLASYYACVRSSRPEAETRADGCCHARAITHACAVRLSTTGSRARREGGGATHACVIARRRGHHPGRAGGDRLACVSRASSAPAPRRHPPTRRGQAGQGSGSGAWRAISVRISESCCTAQAMAELKLSAVCSQGRRPPSSRQCA
jgi:hypothetical protein